MLQDGFGLGELHRAGDEEAVVQDVVVGQRRALREAGRAAGELDVDRLVELQRVGKRRETPPLGVAARRSATKSLIVKSISWPTADTIGKSDSNIARATTSSLKAHKSSKLPPPRVTTIRSR